MPNRVPAVMHSRNEPNVRPEKLKTSSMTVRRPAHDAKEMPAARKMRLMLVRSVRTLREAVLVACVIYPFALQRETA